MSTSAHLPGALNGLGDPLGEDRSSVVLTQAKLASQVSTFQEHFDGDSRIGALGCPTSVGMVGFVSRFPIVHPAILRSYTLGYIIRRHRGVLRDSGVRSGPHPIP